MEVCILTKNSKRMVDRRNCVQSRTKFKLVECGTTVIAVAAPIEHIIKSLWDVANSDGNITPQEEKLIKQIQIDIEIFYRSLQSAKRDNVLSQGELVVLRQLKGDILQRVRQIAFADGVLEEEEEALIAELDKQLTNLLAS